MAKNKKLNALMSLAIAGVVLLGSAPQSYMAAAEANKYYPDYSSYQEEQAAAEQLLAQIGEEGTVLLKNNGTLPFDTNVKNVTMFGSGSVEPCYGGGGSGTGSASSYQTQITPQMALESAGFNVNPRLVNFYQNEYIPTHPKVTTDNSEIKYNYQEPTAEDLKVVEDSYKLYGDAAIIFKYGSGSEGTDKQRTEYDDGVKYSEEEQNVEGATSPGATHTLEFTPREIELIKYVSQHFDKVVLVLNTGNALEMSWVEDFEGVDAVLWAGNPGTSGYASLGKLLNGTVSPSGHLADIYPANFTQDPSWYNYADNSNTTGIDAMYDTEGNKIEGILAGRDKENKGIPVVEYEEGIYYGYRWYETASATNRFAALAGEDVDLADYMPAGETDVYYNRYNGVVYPFGFGLSYTTFDWELVDTEATGAIVADSKVTLKVKVTNTGDVAAKDVVQVYYSAEYEDGGIEKASVNLVQFAKTDTLDPGESQVLEIAFDVKDMASFDYNDANGNDFCGYELEAGDYTITLQTDSHNVKEDCTITRTVAADIKYDGSTDALNWNNGYGNNAEAVFSQGDIYDTLGIEAADGFGEIFTAVTRAGEGLKMPSAPTINTSTVSDETLANITKYNVWTPLEETEEDLWYVEEVPSNWTQGAGVKGEDGLYEIVAADMVGIDPEGTVAIKSDNAAINGKTGKEAWDLFMNQMTLQELTSAMGCRPNAISSIGMEKISAADGPAQLKGSPVGTFWCCETLIGATWNVELATQQGVMVGNEGLYQNCLGWWGPGANIHRSPFSGRNFEYYSQDGVHSGYMAAAVISGAQSKGLVCYLKHFAVNDQETYRESNDGVSTWLSEQAMREIYLKPFELAVKLGGCKGLMTSYNRIGAVSADLNYHLMETVCVGEWGFEGNYVSDANAINTKWYDGGNTKSDILCSRAGGCVNLSNASNLNVNWDATLRGGKGNVTFDATKIQGYTGTETAIEDTSGYYAIRKVAQRFLYINLNSFALRNGVNASAAFGATELTDAYANVSYNKSIAADLADVNAVIISYEVSNGSLPAGMSLTSTGTLTGSATEKGTYSFTVKATIDYTITTTKQYTINVVSPFTVTAVAGDFNALAVGEEFDGNVTFVNASSLQNAKYSATGLPAGMSMAEDGTLYGAPTEAGDYTIVVKCTGSSGRDNVTYTETYNVTVAGEEVEEVPAIAIGDNGNWILNGVDTGIAAKGEKGDTGAAGAPGEAGAAGETPEIEIGENGNWFINGEDTGVAAQGPQGEKGEAGAAGCGSVIGSSVCVLGLISVAGACLFVKGRKED